MAPNRRKQPDHRRLSVNRPESPWRKKLRHWKDRGSDMFRALLCSVVLLGLVPEASAATLSDIFGPNATRHSLTTSTDGDKITVVVDISEQVMKVAVDGRTVYTFDVSTGRAGY